MPPIAVASASTIWYFAAPTKLHKPFRELLIVQSAVDAVAAGRDAGVSANLEVDADDLLDPPFPLPEADDRLDAKLAQEDLVPLLSFVLWRLSYGGGWSSSSGQRGRATILGICAPSARRHQPAYAIMAPLSVHSAGSDSTRARRPGGPSQPGSRVARGWRRRRRPRRAA
jgi:hypothetical protein